jgi:hypothetical protein
MKTCPKCNTEHSKLGKFCSRTCANSRGPKTEEFKQSLREKMSGRKGIPNVNKGRYLVERVSVQCNYCGVDFLKTLTASAKYCSRKCWKHHAGGYRSGSGRSKSGHYKQIYCGSTYELCWVIYNIDHGVKFNRFPGFIENTDLKYYPDFLLDDHKTIVEIKGFENQESVDRKTKLAESVGYTVNVYRKDDLKYAFDYVKKKYNTTKYHTLYDEYKPLYHYTCSCCAETFSRDKQLKTEVVYCSRKCAGKGHKGRKKTSL